MAGTEPDRPRAEEQRGFKQAMVKQMVQTTDQAQRHHHRLLQRQTGDANAQTQQDNADVFQSVVRQQALNVVLHQRVQSADKRGDHPQHQQGNAPPQRLSISQQRDGENAEQTHFHHHGRKQRGGRCAGISMRRRHPTVQRDNARQQAKAQHAQHPNVRTDRQLLRTFVQQHQIQRTVTLPQQQAGNRQQNGAQTAQRKPQFAGGGAAGKERAAQRHNFRHHHQRAEAAGDNRTDSRRQQHVHQQTVVFHFRVAMPVDVVEADKQSAQAKRNQPDRVQRRDQHAVVHQRQMAHHRKGVNQHLHPGQQRANAAQRAANPGDKPAQRFFKRQQKGEHRGEGKPRHRAID